MDDPVAWTKLFTDAGPMGVVSVALALFMWKVLKPLSERVAARHLAFVDSLEDKVSRLVQNSMADSESHTKTHGKLDVIHEDVKHIRNQIGK